MAELMEHMMVVLTVDETAGKTFGMIAGPLVGKVAG